MPARFDREAENLGNVTMLEHVNVEIPDQALASNFYLVGCGFTRDPYLFPGTNNMWVNIGKSQFHLPTGDALVLRGHVGIVTPSREQLLDRFAGVQKDLADTKFSFKEHNDCVEATCPWGNRIRCHAPSSEFGRLDLGIVYVDFDVPAGSADGIARFYGQVMRAPASAAKGRATVAVGRNQHLYFSETKEKLPEYDNHHIQIYIADFSTPYEWLRQRDLITMETDANEWRFQWIVDPRDGNKLFQIEHEVRSMKHHLFNRPLVNRNHGITNMTYQYGQDVFRGNY